MLRSDLSFDYPQELIALERHPNPRVLWSLGKKPAEEITVSQLMDRIPAGDVLVVNTTKVLRRRVFAGELEILFLSSNSENTQWQVLFPARGLALGSVFSLPGGVSAQLIEKGRPQIIETSEPLREVYFEEHGELPLPPYIQKARNERHQKSTDDTNYQTSWAKDPGSLAAPTASFHFSESDLAGLRQKGVHICELVLHVGLGTFLPVVSEDLNDHVMHAESVEIPEPTWALIQKAKAESRGIWALGTTSARAVESCARGHLQLKSGSYQGETRLFLKPGENWRLINRLLTNFHQPESTLLALVGSFAGLENVKQKYQWAIERKFRLFSYGDLSVWIP